MIALVLLTLIEGGFGLMGVLVARRKPVLGYLMVQAAIWLAWTDGRYGWSILP
jgi:hypothetical protein